MHPLVKRAEHLIKKAVEDQGAGDPEKALWDKAWEVEKKSWEGMASMGDNIKTWEAVLPGFDTLVDTVFGRDMYSVYGKYGDAWVDPAPSEVIRGAEYLLERWNSDPKFKQHVLRYDSEEEAQAKIDTVKAAVGAVSSKYRELISKYGE